jgi:hypothetical protein
MNFLVALQPLHQERRRMSLVKRLAATTLLGLTMVAASVQQASAAVVVCYGAVFLGAGFDEYGYYEDWLCLGGVEIYV